MSVSLLAPAILSGISVGLLYGLVGFSVVTLYKASDTLSFAQPALGMFTTFLAYFLYAKAGFSPAVATLAGLGIAAVIGFAAYALVMRPNDGAGAPNRAFRTLGLYSLLIAIATAKFASGQPFNFPVPLPHGNIQLGNSVVPTLTFVTLGISLVLCVGFYLFFTHSRPGLLFRAVADDREVAQLLGIPARRITATVWAMGTVIAYIVAILTVPTGFVSTNTLGNYALYALAGVFVGGINTWVGTFVGGLIVGVVGNVVLIYATDEAAIGAIFLVLLAVLALRPQGILGSEAATRV